jgi:flagellar hook-length control protein FliK
MSPLMQALAQPAGTAEQAPVQPLEIDADATQSDAEIQLNRTGDVRAPVDRAGANLPRFAPHTAQHLAGQITRQFNNGQRVFDIRLDPAELGKVDVRLELRADNRVHAVLSAERPETLAELQRAARDLERSLNEAGLELAEEGLTFQLRDEGGDTPGSQRDPSATTMPIFAEGGEIGLTDEATAPIVQQSKYGFLLSRRSGVDMRV